MKKRKINTTIVDGFKFGKLFPPKVSQTGFSMRGGAARGDKRPLIAQYAGRNS